MKQKDNGDAQMKDILSYDEMKEKLEKIEIPDSVIDTVNSGLEKLVSTDCRAVGIGIGNEPYEIKDRYVLSLISEIESRGYYAWTDTSHLWIQLKRNKDDQYLYEYKRNVAKGVYDPQASFIIDDVNDVSHYSVPREFIDQTGKYREPSVELSYLIAAFQEIDKQVQKQKEEIKELDDRKENDSEKEESQEQPEIKNTERSLKKSKTFWQHVKHNYLWYVTFFVTPVVVCSLNNSARGFMVALTINLWLILCLYFCHNSK